MKFISLAIVGVMAAPIAAFAGGPVVVADEPQVVVAPQTYVTPSADWTGFYAGAALGYGSVSSGGAGLAGNGAVAGVNLGYRYDLGTAVVGGELSYDKDFIALGGGDSLDSTARLKLLLGADMGRTLLYVSGGAARGTATLGGAAASDQGYSASIGADYALTDQWTIGGEVIGDRYTDFDGSGINLSNTMAQVKVGYKF